MALRQYHQHGSHWRSAGCRGAGRRPVTRAIRSRSVFGNTYTGAYGTCVATAGGSHIPQAMSGAVKPYSLGLVAISGDRANSKLGQRSNGALGRVWEQIGNSNPEPGGCRSKMVLVKGGKVQTEQSIARYRGV